MIRCERIVIGLVILCLVSGCSNKSDTPSQDVVIRVDDRELTLAEFNEYFETIRMSGDKEGSQGPGAIQNDRLAFLLQLVEEMIILKRADELHLDISPQELDEAVRDFKRDYSEEGFEYLFLKQAVALGTWKQRLKKRLLMEKVIRQEVLKEISVTPQEVKDYYDKHSKEWSHGEEIRVHQILVQTEDEAKNVLKQLQNGDDFATLARAHSVAPEAQNGGDMGFVARGNLPACLEKPLFKLKPGDVSPVVKTPYGFHIFKVIEKRDTGIPKIEESIERIKRAIRKEKVGDAYGRWLAELRSRYPIEVNEEIIVGVGQHRVLAK